MTSYLVSDAEHAARHAAGGEDPVSPASIGAASIDQDWQPNTLYVVGELAVNSGIVYRCTTLHTSGGSFVGTNWTVAAAPINSAALTGVPTAPTAAPGTDDTQVATTAYTDAAVLVETTRAEGVEASKAPLASPALTGSPTVNGQPIGSGVSVPIAGGTMTGALILSGAPITNLQAATKAYVDAVAVGLQVKTAAVVASTVNQSSLSGLLTIDGVTLTSGQRVLLLGQTTSSQNGLWLAASGAWTRPTDFASGSQQQSTLVFVSSGSSNVGTSWTLVGSAVTVDTSPESWTLFSSLAGALLKTNSLSDLIDAGTGRLNMHIPVLSSCQAVATANVALTGVQTVDSYSLAIGDQVLLTGQSTASQNGPWVVASGAWTRPTDFATGASVKGRQLQVNAGTLYGGSLWVMLTTTAVTIGTTATTWQQANRAQNDARYQATGLAALKANNGSDFASIPQVRKNLSIVPSSFVGGAQNGVLGVDPQTPVTIASTAAPADYNAYPGICVCPDGSLLVIYRNANNDSPSALGTLVGQRSVDGGMTWSTPTAVYSVSGFDVRDATLTLLDDGLTIVLESFLGHSGGPGGGHVLNGSFTLTSTDNGHTWSGPSILNTGLTLIDAASGPICDLGNGTILAGYYGWNIGDTFWSCGVVKSTDKGVTWGSPIIVGHGPTDSISYVEPNIIMLNNGTLLMAIRDITNVRVRYATSTDGVTWTSPAAALLYPNSADGRPNILQTTSGALTLCIRSASNQYVITSWDNGATWSNSDPLPVTGTGRYSQMVQVAPNVVAIAYGLANGTTNTSSIYFGYLYDGFGTTPLGSPIAEPKTLTQSIDVFAQPLQTHWSEAVNSSSFYNSAIQSTNLQGVTASYRVRLQKGTYDFYFTHASNNTLGIATVTLDGVTIGTYDQYNASSLFNQVSKLGSIVATLSGVHVLTLTYSTKNASSSGYAGNLAAPIYCVRTGAAS